MSYLQEGGGGGGGGGLRQGQMSTFYTFMLQLQFKQPARSRDSELKQLKNHENIVELHFSWYIPEHSSGSSSSPC